jgi:hypothetical protein
MKVWTIEYRFPLFRQCSGTTTRSFCFLLCSTRFENPWLAFLAFLSVINVWRWQETWWIKVSWPRCWHVCANFLKKSFRSLSPLLASKFWAWRKNTSAITKCSCLWSFCSFQLLRSSRRQYEVLIDLQSVFNTAFPNVKIKPIGRVILGRNKKQIKVWQATVIWVHRGEQMMLLPGYTPTMPKNHLTLDDHSTGITIGWGQLQH